jgi:hypothetical protein
LKGTPSAFSCFMKRRLVLALLLTLSMGPLQCATLERLSLEEMIAKSTAIVRAKATNSWAAFFGSVIYTHYQLRVSERFKGLGPNTVEVVVPGGVVNNLRQDFAGAPQLRAGDEYIFFLWTSRAGFTQVIGLSQGLFVVAPDGTRDPAVTRNASREVMLDAGTGRQIKDQTLTMHLSELRAWIASTLARARAGAK